MPRPLQRVRLESGFKLNLNSLVRRGFIKPGALTGPVGIAWTDGCTGQQIASGSITADMSGEQNGSLRIRLGRLDQLIGLVARRRHFGGRQWFFMCPHLHSLATVLWMPPGAHSFACRERWRRQVAYASQFMDRTARAHQGKAKINSRLCSIGRFDLEEWDLPPKPKWMRWRTYNRVVERFDRYEAMLEEGLAEAIMRLGLPLG
ncbi:MAG: hypothetical protein WAL37_20355 [Xanthobacteraceae bacterium]|jgi:hypothetical protein